MNKSRDMALIFACVAILADYGGLLGFGLLALLCAFMVFQLLRGYSAIRTGKAGNRN